MKTAIVVLIFSFFFCTMAQAQSIQVLSDSATASLRGLSVVNDNIVWVSGSNGTVGRSIDGGETWKWMTVKGFEKVDFRDVEAFDGVTAVIMGTASPAYILKTINGGETWNMVFKDDRAAMFLDAMEFWNEESGIVIGDPVDGKIFIARSFDGGSTWQHIPEANYPVGEEGEVMFAASGTNIRAISLSEAAFVTGGKRSRIFIRDHKYDLPLLQGKETTGANSFAVYSSKKRKQSSRMVVAGGDFAADTVRAGNFAISRNGGKTWTAPVTPPAGYRSCVEYISRKKIITCGTTGVDISLDGGDNWKLISMEGFHVCRKAKAGRSVFLAGAGGRVAKLVW